MRYIYCDNSSTSFPKAPGLGTVIGRHLDNNGYNISRGAYGKAYSLEGQVAETRELICDCFGGSKPQNVVFTSGATAGLNLVIRGLLKPGDRVITTSMEHNSVVRPIVELSKSGVIWDEFTCDKEGVLDLKELEDVIKSGSKAMIITHGSNVCGTLTSIEEIGKLCKKHGVLFCIDASQTAGSIGIDMEKCNADAVVFPGHKGLMGPQGIGVVLMSDIFAEECTPIILGGTGSLSHEDIMPDFMPDKFQPGTMNIPGIIGLNHSVNFLRSEGIEAICQKKMELTSLFINEVLNMPELKLIGKKNTDGRCAVISIDFPNMDNGEVGYVLESEFGIMTRCGLHCAPHAHITLGTFPNGTVRFSFGYYNTKEDITYVVDSIRAIIKMNT